jgi:predicted nucleotidyltransferase
MYTKTEILSKLAELKPILYKDYAVKEIGLFGSYSDNSNKPNLLLINFDSEFISDSFKR